MRFVLFGIGLLLLLLAVWYGVVRFWPGNPAVWHIDPVQAPDPGVSGVRVTGENAPVFAAAPAVVMAAFDAAVLEEGATRFAGNVEDGFVTYLTRTKNLKFPDYVTVRVAPEGDGTRLSYRAVTGTKGGDAQTNAARMERLLDAVAARLP
ncbi:MAG: DUF1499 domain-containing protein [Pseudomonadota bacterium]